MQIFYLIVAALNVFGAVHAFRNGNDMMGAVNVMFVIWMLYNAYLETKKS